MLYRIFGLNSIILTVAAWPGNLQRSCNNSFAIVKCKFEFPGQAALAILNQKSNSLTNTHDKIKLAISEIKAQGKACRKFLILTAPKYTAIV